MFHRAKRGALYLLSLVQHQKIGSQSISLTFSCDVRKPSTPYSRNQGHIPYNEDKAGSAKRLITFGEPVLRMLRFSAFFPSVPISCDNVESYTEEQ